MRLEIFNVTITLLPFSWSLTETNYIHRFASGTLSLSFFFSSQVPHWKTSFRDTKSICLKCHRRKQVYLKCNPFAVRKTASFRQLWYIPNLYHCWCTFALIIDNDTSSLYRCTLGKFFGNPRQIIIFNFAMSSFT